MTLAQQGGPPPLSGMTMGSPSLTAPEQLSPEDFAVWLAAAELEKKKKLWASWVGSEFNKCKSARAPFERQWYLNLAFQAGKQYVTPVNLTASGFRLTSQKVPPWRVRLVVNKIRTAIRTECSKLTTSKPIPTVLPATNEDEDFTAAGVSEQVLKSKFATADFESTYRSFVWWGCVMGTSFMKQYYDPSAKDWDAMVLPKPPEFPNGGGPIPDDILDTIPGLRQKLDTPSPAVGKITVERVTAFHVFVPDLLAEDIEDQPYVIHVMTKSLLWVKQTYGINATCDSRSSSTILDSALIIAKGSEEHLDSVHVKEVWIKPGGHVDFPEGGMLTVVNDRIVGEPLTKWPYPFPEYPFYKFNGIPTGGFYSDSIIVDLIPLQKEYNKKRSQAIEIQDTSGKPRLLYVKGSLNPRMISSEPGASVPYIGGYEPPIVMPGAEVPLSMVNEIVQLQTEFDDVSGQHEISRGQTPSAAITSGTAIAYLQEQDDAKLNYQVASIENATERLGKHYLSLASHYWDDDRLIKITGKNDTFEALHWKQNMLRGNTDVKVQTGSALPFSKAARTALLTEMMQNGFIDPQSGMEMLNFGGMDKLLDEALIDKRQAMRENLKMANAPEKMLMLLLNPAPGPNGELPIEQPGINPETGTPDPNGPPQKFNGDGTPFQPQPPVPVNSWDNHEAHLQWHNHYRKTQQFELLSEPRKQAFELHCQLHQMAMQAQIINNQGQVLEDNSGQPEEELGPDGNPVDPAATPQEDQQAEPPNRYNS